MVMRAPGKGTKCVILKKDMPSQLRRERSASNAVGGVVKKKKKGSNFL